MVNKNVGTKMATSELNAKVCAYMDKVQADFMEAREEKRKAE